MPNHLYFYPEALDDVRCPKCSTAYSADRPTCGNGLNACAECCDCALCGKQREIDQLTDEVIRLRAAVLREAHHLEEPRVHGRPRRTVAEAED